jgi:hypothetical protein
LGDDLSESPPEFIELLTIAFCQKRPIALLKNRSNSLQLALSDPLDYPTIQDLRFRLNIEVVAVVVSQTSIVIILDRVKSISSGSQQTHKLRESVKPEDELQVASDTKYERRVPV